MPSSRDHSGIVFSAVAGGWACRNRGSGPDGAGDPSGGQDRRFALGVGRDPDHEGRAIVGQQEVDRPVDTVVDRDRFRHPAIGIRSPVVGIRGCLGDVGRDVRSDRFGGRLVGRRVGEQPDPVGAELGQDVGGSCVVGSFVEPNEVGRAVGRRALERAAQRRVERSPVPDRLYPDRFGIGLAELPDPRSAGLVEGLREPVVEKLQELGSASSPDGG